jgi:hypothetical protein
MSATTHPARTLSVTIARPPEVVAAYVADGHNLPAWSFVDAVRADGDAWIVATGSQEARLRFVPPNAFGVLDHEVTLADGTRVHVPMRVVPNGEGSEVVFTLFRLPGTTDEAFDADAAQVSRDLAILRHVLEDGADSRTAPD